MKQRCSNPNERGYRHYGGRGIKVCERWQRFENFWADMGPAWQFGLSLDRIDNNGDYEPGNCRWATRGMQSRNTSRNRMVDTPSGRMCLKDAARRAGIPYQTALRRFRNGLNLQDVLAPPMSKFANRGASYGG